MQNEDFPLEPNPLFMDEGELSNRDIALRVNFKIALERVIEGFRETPWDQFIINEAKR